MEILTDIYERLDRAEAVRDLSPEDKGQYFLISCPSCNRREAYIYKNRKPYIVCNRKNKCGYNKSLWDYIQEKGNLTGQETLKELARIANYTLPHKALTQEEIDRQRERENILEEALNLFIAHKDGAKAYFKGRGWTDEEIEEAEIGFYSSQDEIINYLSGQGFSKDSIKTAGLLTQGYGETHKIVIPYRDPVGRLKGFIVRATDTIEPKYKFSYGIEKDSPFNLNEARKEKTLILVEGFIDAILLTLRGIKGVIAIGGSTLTETQLDTALRYGAKDFIIALDNDEAGRKGTEKAISLIYKKGVKAYVMPYPEVPKYKDPDELIRAEGIEDFNERLKRALNGVSYKALSLRQKYGKLLTTDRGIEDYIDEALAYEETILDPFVAKSFIESICSELWITAEDLEPRRKDYHEKKARQNLEKGFKELLTRGEKLLQEGKITELSKFIADEQNRLKIEYEKLRVKPSVSLSSYLIEKYERESRRDPNDLLGYNLRKFKRLAKNIDGIQAGLYIIGAETNIGKTAFLANLFLDVLQSNPDTTGLYFSLDDNKDTIINRFLGILTDSPLNRIQRKQETPDKQEELRKAYEHLIILSQEERFILKDIAEIDHIETLEIEISKRAQRKLFVMIDGLYNLEVGNGYGGLREENIDRANKVKALVDSYKIPIVVTGEVRKKTIQQKKHRNPEIDDLMETGKFAYNANLVLLLYPEDAEKFREEDAPTLIVSYSKNKLSYFKGIQKLKFTRMKGQLEEVEEDAGRVKSFDELRKDIASNL